jgi:hypothetical protein
MHLERILKQVVNCKKVLVSPVPLKHSISSAGWVVIKG